VVVTVEQGVLDLTLCAAALALGWAAGDAIGLEAGLLEDNVETAVRGRDTCAWDGCLYGEHGGVGRRRGHCGLCVHFCAGGEFTGRTVGEWETLLENCYAFSVWLFFFLHGRCSWLFVVFVLF
jgi:hypothetical protein